MTTTKTPLYIPFSDVCRTLFINIPDAMREATYRALTRLEREVGDVDAYVAAKLNYCHTQCGEDEFKEGLRTLCSAFANEQVDALALAIRNYEERDGKGIIIADQTGIGKGRNLSGMIKYAHLNGMIPVFITKHPTLFTDIYRDLYDIGMDDFVVYKHLLSQTEFDEGDEISEDAEEQVEGIDEEDVPDTDTLHDLKETFKLNPNYDKEASNKKTFVPFIINGKSAKTHIRDFDGNIIYEGLPNTSSEFRNIINGFNLPDPYNLILCTYSQFGRLSKKMDYLKSIAHKAFFILDESHTASGDSRVGKYLRELTSMAKGTVFSSATFAKRPDNFLLYINKTSLINANMRQEQIVGAIEKGGVSLQEVISSQLTEEGYLIRRERTYDENTQVNYIYLNETQEAVQEKTITHPEWNKKNEHWQKYDNIISYLYKIIKFQEDYVLPAVEALSQGIVNRYSEMGALGAKELKRTAKLGAFTNPLFSQLFNFTYQLFFSLKADIVADVAIAHLKAGRKPIIAFKSTLESMLNYLVNDEGEKVKIGDKIRDDYSVILEKLLFSTLRYREEHPDGTIIKFFDPEDIGGDFAIVFKAIHNEIKKMKFGIPSSPIDYILNKIRKAGYIHVEEITARTRKLIPSEKEGFVRIAPRKPIPVANIARQFQNNEIDCLLINQSGATGISLHATREKTTLKTDADVQQRAMIIMQAELDINIEVQKRGRIYRTGQIKYPIYEYVISSIPAEQRLMMMLQRKLKSLDANVSSNQAQSKAMLEFPDFLNKYGDEVVAGWLKNHPRENQITGDLIKVEEGKKEIPHDLAYRISGRIALTDCTTQQTFFDDVYKAYVNFVEELKRKDEYDLELGEVQNFDAELKEKDVSIIGTGVEGYFGGNTYLSTYLINNLRKPMKFEEVKEMVTQSLGDNKPDDIVQKLLTDYKRYNDHRKDEDENYYKEKFEKERKELQKLPLTEERKKEKLDNVKDTERETMERIAERYDLNRTLKRHLEYFTVGRVIAYPALDYSQTNNVSHGVVVSVSPSHNEKNPYAPSNIHLKMEVNTTERNINIPFSQDDVLESIIDATSNKDFDNLKMEDIEDDWDSDSKAMQKDRIQRYITTGNLLQAYSKSGKTGRLVRFTLKKGSEEKGILLPISYDPMSGSDEDKDKVKVPARMALHFIKALSMGNIIGTDAGMTIGRDYGFYRVSIPSRKEYKDIYTNSALTELIDGKEFIQSGRTMSGKMNDKKLPELINFMAESRMNVMVTRTLYDIVKEQHPELGKETIQDVQEIEVDYAQKEFYEKLYVLKTMLEKGKAINVNVIPETNDSEKFLKEHILVVRPGLDKPTQKTQPPSYKLITDNIKNFFPKSQLQVIADNLRGEEKEHFKDILIEFDKRINEMPGTYETDKIPSKDKIVWLHYFTGDSDWYIVEKDKGSADDEVKGKQLQAFGYANMGQGEWGYISIEEMLGSRVELDLYFNPVKFSEIERKVGKGGKIYQQKEMFLEDGQVE